jgi:opacity protein-like surface antigen
MFFRGFCAERRPRVKRISIQEEPPSMKSSRIFALLALTFLAAPLLSAADFGVRAGRYNDSGENFVGAEVVFDIGAINVNPNLEYSLADGVTAGTANLDITFDLINVASFTPYVGAGVGLSYVDTDLGATSTDVVGNLIGGVSFNIASLKPYAQVKYFRLLDDNNAGGQTSDDIALTIGLRF